MGLVNPAMPNVGEDPRGTGESTLRDSVTALLNEFNGNIESANLKDGSVAITDQVAGAGGPATGAFSAYRTAALTRLNGEVITFDTELVDVSGWFDIVTNQGRYTPQVPGYYAVTWGVTSSVNLVADKFWAAALYKNAVLEQEGQLMWSRATTTTRSMGVADVVQMNGTTDFLDIRILHDVGATTGIAATRAQTFFKGHLIGRS